MQILEWMDRISAHSEDLQNQCNQKSNTRVWYKEPGCGGKDQGFRSLEKFWEKLFLGQMWGNIQIIFKIMDYIDWPVSSDPTSRVDLLWLILRLIYPVNQILRKINYICPWKYSVWILGSWVSANTQGIKTVSPCRDKM